MADTNKMRGELLAAFEAYKSKVAKAMIGGGEGSRVRQILERLSFSDFEAGWIASREAVVVQLPKPDEIDTRDGYREKVLWPDDVAEAIEAAGLKVAS